jgi:hypothetical protein
MAKSMENTQSPVCKNCAQPLQGKYCSACGQSARVDRIDWGNLAQELSESVFQINRGLLFTLLELFRRPGQSIQEFLDGKRKNHLKPISYVLTLSTIYFLVTKLTGQKTYLDDFVDGYQNSLMEGGSGTGLLQSSGFPKTTPMPRCSCFPSFPWPPSFPFSVQAKTTSSMWSSIPT